MVDDASIRAATGMRSRPFAEPVDQPISRRDRSARRSPSDDCAMLVLHASFIGPREMPPIEYRRSVVMHHA